jgi:Leucine-rich repeat (LRR) protein
MCSQVFLLEKEELCYTRFFNIWSASMITTLPNEVLCLIVDRLDYNSLQGLALSSSYFQELVSEHIKAAPKKFSHILKEYKIGKIPKIFHGITRVDLSKHQLLRNSLLTTILEHLPRVYELNISETSVDSFDSLLPQKNNLQILHISNCCYLKPDTSAVLTQFPRLHTIIQEFTECAKETTEQTRTLALRALDLHGCSKVQDIDLAQLARSLEKLSLSGTDVNTLTNIPPNLNTLDLSSCNRLPESAFATLSNLKNLRTLILKKNRQFKTLGWLQGLPNLSTLDISYTKVAELPILRKITQLKMANTSISSWRQLLEYPSLQSLDITNCPVNNENARIITKLKLQGVKIIGEGPNISRSWS